MKVFHKKTIAIAITVFAVGCAQHDEQTMHETKALPSTEMVFSGQQNGSSEDRILSEQNTPQQRLNISASKQITGKTKAYLRERKETLPNRVPAREGVMLNVPAQYASPMSLDTIRMASETLDRENYAHYDSSAVMRAAEHPLSTFSIDVDTGSYANIRRLLKAGTLPPRDAVRAEELINYFSYQYPVHVESSRPFALYKEIAPTPWNSDTYLLHIGIKGYDLSVEQLPPANLVFLVDVSGSMQSADKLELLKSSLKLLTKQLGENDTVSIVVYAGASGVVLAPTSGNDKAKIVSALERLSAGGSTNGAAGIRLAYAMAEQAFIEAGINRVLLATDGDFNVGTANIEQLKDLIAEKRKSGIALSTLGFGSGNYNDHLMEQIADVGNGNYAYIDTLNEAQKVLVDEMGSTMLTIARDVKIQIEFNPAVVSEYRLLGYENRLLKREDFNNDNVDAGEIGAGHTVTAIYEIRLNNSEGTLIEPLRYQLEQQQSVKDKELAFLRLRYKEPGADTSKLLQWVIAKDDLVEDINQTTNAFRFAAAVASFAEELRGGINTATYGYDDIVQLAQRARGEDPFGYRGEFLGLVNLAQSISQPDRHTRITNQVNK